MRAFSYILIVLGIYLLAAAAHDEFQVEMIRLATDQNWLRIATKQILRGICRALLD